jgi:DNA (cytosine-5)-methyltransferase 1
MKKKLYFADLFAGIGGFHIALENAGAHCTFVSEWDESARVTYERNFRNRAPEVFGSEDVKLRRFVGDITKITSDKKALGSLPDFNILCAGFPCQPFSQAGQKKGMDETRGTLFFDILSILRSKKPDAFFLENVRGLLTHESPSGIKTMAVIRENLNRAGYHFREFVVKASDYGVPQHRPRLFIIGFRDKSKLIEFQEPPKQGLKLTLDKVLGGKTDRTIGYTLRVGGRSSGIGDRRNWDTYIVNGKVMRITPQHGLKLQGFPSWFKFPSSISETQAMKQLGNSVAVPAIEAFATEIVRVLNAK